MWKEVRVERYDYMLGMLPPAIHLYKGFLVGEPASHRTCSVTGYTLPDYAAFVRHLDMYFEGPNLTMPEFRALDPVKVSVVASPL